MLDRLRQLFRSSFLLHSNNSSKSKRVDGQPPLHRLPTELVCMIANELPADSRACLALSSKWLYSMLSTTLGGLRFAAEQPFNFQDEKGSRPLCYHFDRWWFLYRLERDASDRWALCSCCFKLHPKAQFPEAELRLPPEKRACRIAPPLTAANGWRNQRWPMGIVDLANAALAAPWWHQCRKVYGDIEIQVALNPFVSQNAELGVITRYNYTFSPQSATLSPRLCCPHRNLDTWVNDVLTCQATHPDRASCPNAERRLVLESLAHSGPKGCLAMIPGTLR